MGVFREKNDEVDLQKNELYAYKNREDVKLWIPKRPVIVQLDHLTVLRDRLVKSIKVLKTSLSDAKGLVDKKPLNSETLFCKSSTYALKEDLKAVDKKIEPVIGTEVLITTNEFKDITDPKKYACYSVFAPFEHSPGKYKGKSKVSNKANKKSQNVVP